MVYTSDPRILLPLGNLLTNLNAIKELIITFQGKMVDLGDEVNSKRDPAKIRRIVKGPWYASNKGKLETLNKLVTEVNGLVDFYLQIGGKVNARSDYESARSAWKSNDKERSGCLSQLSNIFDIGESGFIISALSRGEIGEDTRAVDTKYTIFWPATLKEREEFYQKEFSVTGPLTKFNQRFAALRTKVEEAITNFEYVKSQYSSLGIDKSVF